jgi:subtilisin family serine protease
MEEAVRALATTHGITVAIASGNYNGDACNTSPASVPEALTVAATGRPDDGSSQNGEGMYVDSNQGACVDLLAPGVDIWSACAGQNRCGTATSNSTMAFASGTSMAAPAVAGVAAKYLERHPQASPDEVKGALVASATPGKIDSSMLRPGTPNLLLMARNTEPLPVQASQGPKP